MGDELFRQQIIRDEGKRRFPYKDTRGNITIGIGRNLTGRGLTPEEIDYLYQTNVREVEGDLDTHLPWWRGLSGPRQRVLKNMCFNMGISTLLTFKHTLAAMERGSEAVPALMLASRWAKQVGERAHRLASQWAEDEDRLA